MGEDALKDSMAVSNILRLFQQGCKSGRRSDFLKRSILKPFSEQIPTLPRPCRFAASASSHSNLPGSAGPSVCGQPLYQRQRRAEYHRRKIDTGPIYVQVVNDSQKKWPCR
jgi:hypothetical protein